MQLLHSPFSTTEKSILKFTITLGLALTPNLYFTGAFFLSRRERFRRSLFPAGDLPRPPGVLLKELLIQRDEVIQFS